MLAQTPQPPYYAVIFATTRTEGDNGYAEMANKMMALAQKQPGFLGVDSVRAEIGITVSYWKDLDSIHQWKQNAQHKSAKQKGKDSWYKDYTLRIAKVDIEY